MRFVLYRLGVLKEQAVMKAIICALRGIPTPNIVEESIENGKMRLSPSKKFSTLVYTSPASLKSLLGSVCEAANLLCDIQSYADDDFCSQENHKNFTLTESSLRFALRKELETIVGIVNDVEVFLQSPGSSFFVPSQEDISPAPTVNLILLIVTRISKWVSNCFVSCSLL